MSLVEGLSSCVGLVVDVTTLYCTTGLAAAIILLITGVADEPGALVT